MRRNMLLHFEPSVEPDEGSGTGEPAAEVTFTQADLDRIVRERLARQKAQFADYDELKAKAEKFDEFDAASKTELERAQARLVELEREATEAKERAQRVLVESAITTAAAGRLADPSDAVAFIDRGAIEFGDDGAPTNVSALVEALVEAKPHLAADARRPVPADFGARGGSPSTDSAALMQMSDGDFLKALKDPTTVKALSEKK